MASVRKVCLLADYIAQERAHQHLTNLLERAISLSTALDYAECKSEAEIAEVDDDLYQDILDAIHDPDAIHDQLESIRVSREMVEASNLRCADALKDLLLVTLPKALWKLCLNFQMDDVEQLIINGGIPQVETHPSFKLVETIFSYYFDNYRRRVCRQCGKRKRYSCSSCNKVFYCSAKCMKEASVDFIFGHALIECKLLEQK